MTRLFEFIEFSNTRVHHWSAIQTEYESIPRAIYRYLASSATPVPRGQAFSPESPAPPRSFLAHGRFIGFSFDERGLREKRCLIRIVSDARTTATINRFHEQVDVVSEATSSSPPAFVSSFVLFLCRIKPADRFNGRVGTIRSRRYRRMSRMPVQPCVPTLLTINFLTFPVVLGPSE